MRWVVGSDGVIGNLSGGGGGGVRSNRVITLQLCITFHFLRRRRLHQSRTGISLSDWLVYQSAGEINKRLKRECTLYTLYWPRK